MLWWHGSGWDWLAMTVVMFAFWGLLIWALAALLGDRLGGQLGRGPEKPEELLARRFAAGEIDEDEYRARLETLRATRSVHTPPSSTAR